MQGRVVVALILCSSLAAGLAAQPSSSVQELIEKVEELVKDKDAKVGEMKLHRTRLENELPALKTAAEASGATEEDKKWYSRAKAAAKEIGDAIQEKEDPSIADLIGSTKPMTAVLFSGQDRNSFEVVKNPFEPEATTGIINQSGSGSTAGILVAAEAPFAYPNWSLDGTTIPIGAWFGVNLTTGGGDEVSDVELAAGLSFAFISRTKVAKLKAGDGPGLAGSAKLLLGVVYGEVATLGPKDDSSNLRPGDSYPLGETVPLRKDKEISLALGIGFRF